MIRRIFFILLFFNTWNTFSQTPRIYTASEILLQLKKIQVLGSVLYIAAHPDDENNTLLPYLAKEKLYRTAYLSLTRGDGGQNLIGNEQGVELGLIRTQELLAARNVDGAEQYFTRAYEFGFSKSAKEALRIWDKEKILADVVWTIRRYQPDVIINRFPPDARAGHGHHAASAVLSIEAYEAAADPKRFPEQLKYGVKPWKAKRLIWNSFNFGNAAPASADQMQIDIGGYNALLGKSYGELGAEARTMHKCQGEGRPRRRGPSIEYFTHISGEAAKAGLMDGIDISWSRLPGGAAVQVMIDAIVKKYQVDQPARSVPALVALYKAIKALPAGTWATQKLLETADMLRACAGLFIEASSAQNAVVQGDTLKFGCLVNTRAGLNAVLKSIRIDNMDSSFSTKLEANQNFNLTVSLPVSPSKPISQPYWLEYPLTGGIFDVRDQLLIGKAENDPSFLVHFDIIIEGQDIPFTTPVLYKFTDQTKGDVYQPIPVLPKLELNYAQDNYLSLNNQPARIGVHVRKNGMDKNSYTIRQEAPANWTNSLPLISFKPQAGSDLSETAVLQPGSAEINSTGELLLHTADGKYDGYTKTIRYDHIPAITYFPKAKANLVKLDIKVVGKKVGYIEGAGDKVPAALEAMGYEVSTLGPQDVYPENLRQFDAIVVGIRAYNIYEWLSIKNDILNKYVEEGGNLLVQYLKSNEVGARRVQVAPYSFVVNARTRVTEEDAKVNFLLPDHPVLNSPNKITEKDFEGWVQERSTYQAEQTDPHFIMPLGMNDTGEPQTNGSLAIAKFGKGNFIYSSLVFFRELPAGVPGAYRLLANVLALPKGN